jgi:CDP-diacylglycerol--glycerol-3-phosphate 3-phosphatidyltransferase
VIERGDDVEARPVQASAWNIANALTILRMALVPVFAWFLLYDGGHSTSYRLFAAGIFVVATATDHIDGHIARAKGLVTDFGKVSDPIADKALMGMALIGLSLIDLLPWWVTAVVVVREVGVTALRFVVIRHGVMPASRGGKVKTALQATAILLYVLPLYALALSGLWQTIAAVIMASAVIVTVATGVDYVLRAHTLRNTSPRARAKRKRRAAEDQQASDHEETTLKAAELDTGIQTAALETAALETAALETATLETATLDVASDPAAERAGTTLDAATVPKAARHTAGTEV